MLICIIWKLFFDRVSELARHRLNKKNFTIFTSSRSTCIDNTEKMETRKIETAKEMMEMVKRYHTFLLVYLPVSFACGTSIRKRCNLFLSPTIETLNEVVTFYEASSYGRWWNFYPGLKFFPDSCETMFPFISKKKNNPAIPQKTHANDQDIKMKSIFRYLFESFLIFFKKSNRFIYLRVGEEYLDKRKIIDDATHYRLLVFLTGSKGIIYNSI